jgi:hypothetical protein
MEILLKTLFLMKFQIATPQPFFYRGAETERLATPTIFKSFGVNPLAGIVEEHRDRLNIEPLRRWYKWEMNCRLLKNSPK